MNFDSKYTKLTGYPKPLSWQKRLYNEYFVKGQIPGQLDLPTGLGKTSVMALWLIARAEKGTNLPRRLVYIVDRRAVVDQATHFAERLRENISASPELKALKRELGLGNTELPISTLRGAFADNKLWLENPANPAIIVGTIDMIGSRLLFEGYGVSRRMRPFHAGLLGVDSLFVLDEAHLCPPFESLLTTIGSESRAFGSLSKDEKLNDPPLHFLSLSATPHRINSRPSQMVFSLNPTDKKDDFVKRRLSAKKLLEFYEVDNKEKIQKLAEHSVKYGVSKEPARVLVYCNSRKDALKVKQEIDKQWKRTKGEAISELMVGERRAYERMNLETWLIEKGFLNSKKSDSKATAFLIATSAGEVGIDLDADHMVCDLVSWERMVQRLGRVNRRANCGHCAYIDVFSVNPEQSRNASAKKKEEYQSLVELNLALKAPFERLRDMGEENGRVKVSLNAILDLKSPSCKAVLEKASTPSPLYPALTRPLLEAWSMTSLKEHSARPEVAPWLRGWTDEEPQTTIVWRKYLPKQQIDTSEQTASKSMVSMFFTHAPIHPSERLEAETRVVLDWLLKRARNLEGKFNNELACIVIDRAGEKVNETEITFDKLANISKKLKEQLERELPDATIVVDARLCGLSNGLLDEKSELEVPTADFSQEWQNIESEKDHRMVEFRIKRLSSEEEDEGLKIPDDLGNKWKHIHTFDIHLSKSGRVISGLAVFKWHDAANARSVLSRPQLLKDHSQQVLDCICTIVQQLDLPNDEIEAFKIAAEFHDEGKNSKLWQNAMNAPKNGKGPYAKTGGGGNLHLLRGYRHEFGSLVDVQKRNLPLTMRDLIMHLIASHHGYARPIISSEGCDAGPPSALKSIAGEASLRFAKLQKHYGPWGLAWREALFRAADQMASRNWSSGI